MFIFTNHFRGNQGYQFMTFWASHINGGFSESSSSTGNSQFSFAASGSLDGSDPNEEILETPHLRLFNFSKLKNATKGFKPATMLGERGFKMVYKEWINDKPVVPSNSGSKIPVTVKKLNSECSRL